MNKQPKPGDRIRITSEVLPDYGKEFIIVGKIPKSNLYKYLPEVEYFSSTVQLCNYAGVSQFEIIN